MKKPNVNDALIALDMVHADLWTKRESLRSTETKSLIVKEVEVECLIKLVEAAMIDLGFAKSFTK